ncbi:PKD-like family protein [Chitinophaga eiseniae]|uniref:PKD-like family protein n=1 Tax=Chitinophaga eiseniae TaxID=634771 RepID=A0A1T4MQE9_9BACT|nr:PKD-like family lipoprotein [Chitinophaga eiseniae]SJZ69279.1 PKD-like family protein [Chitinophaga eiseniae]
MYKYILGILSVIVLAGCYKDKGNYTYTELNAVTISGIDSSYSLLQGARLQIKPVLAFTKDASGDTSKYRYEWLAIAKVGNTPVGDRYDLATTRDLDISVTLPPSKDYAVHYRVTDKATGVMFKYVFNLTVSIVISKGLLVLSDVNGKARLDMLSEYPKKYTMYTDVLRMLGSTVPRNGASVDVTVVSTGYYLSTTAGTHKINTNTFGWSPTNSISYEFQSKMPENMIAQRLMNTFGGVLCYADSNLYVYSQAYQVRYNLPVNYLAETKAYFKISRHIAYNNRYMIPIILYDETNHRFVRYTAPNSECSLMPEGTLFNYQDPSKELLYMTWNTYSNGMMFALLQDRTTKKVMLARVNASADVLRQNSYDEMAATDIDKATLFAVDPVNGYVFYAVGGKLYEYDVSLKTAKLMLDRPGSEITLLNNASDGLVVGFYQLAGPAETGGSWEKYTVPSVNGPLELKESYQGFGKIVSWTTKSS